MIATLLDRDPSPLDNPPHGFKHTEPWSEGSSPARLGDFLGHPRRDAACRSVRAQAMSAAESLEIDLGRHEDWRDHAACHGQLQLFFARKAERPEARARREAKALRLCNACVVRVHCRDFARQNREYGFWGGESEEERHLLGYTLTAPIGVRTRLAAPADPNP